MRLIVVILLVLSGQFVIGQVAYSSMGKWEFSFDDQETWVKEFPMEAGIYWLKAPVEISEELDSNTIYGLGISLLGSSEVYWDGVYLGSNGKIGRDKESEEPGVLEKGFVLSKDQVKPGLHEVKVRFSNHHAGKEMRYYGIVLIDFVKGIEEPLIDTAFIHIYAGFFLIIGIFYLLRFVFDRSQMTALLFGFLCLGFFALIIMEYLRNYYHYPYQWHFVRLRIILGITVFISFILTSFFTYRFKLKPIWILYIIQVGLTILFILYRNFGYDYSTNFTMILGFAVSSIITIQAILKDKRDAWLLLASVLPLPFALFFASYYYDTILYVGFGNLVFLNLISLANQEKRTNEEKLKIQTLSERLKLDLLKKNIQPHFINNSIMSAIDWIERSPEKGIDFLFALSREFDILLDISEKKLIPMIKEIELCRAHLEIMSFRKEIKYTLSTGNIDEYELIPPAVLLTIIENGISHQVAIDDKIDFVLTEDRSDKERIITVEVSGEASSKSDETSSGTGNKYIKARLQESYPNQWKFESFETEHGWKTLLTIFVNK
jgi:hypothetical protein